MRMTLMIWIPFPPQNHPRIIRIISINVQITFNTTTFNAQSVETAQLGLG